MSEIDDSKYLVDSKGRYVPRELVKDIDLARHELVIEIAERAAKMSAELAKFKRQLMEDVQAFVELSAERYDVKLGGARGGVVLTSYDGRFRIVRAAGDQLTFDERLLVAKTLVDQCIHEWTGDARPEVRALIDQAFQVDKAGKISTERVLSLRSLEIDHPKWKEAMRAIGDSIRVAATRSYIRVYRRIGDSDNYEAIGLDMNSV